MEPSQIKDVLTVGVGLGLLVCAGYLLVRLTLVRIKLNKTHYPVRLSCENCYDRSTYWLEKGKPVTNRVVCKNCGVSGELRQTYL